MGGDLDVAAPMKRELSTVPLVRWSAWTFAVWEGGLPADWYRLAAAVPDGGGGSPIGRLHDRMPAGFVR